MKLRATACIRKKHDNETRVTKMDKHINIYIKYRTYEQAVTSEIAPTKLCLLKVGDIDKKKSIIILIDSYRFF